MCCILVECSSPFGSQNTEWNDFLDVYKLIERLRKKQQSKFCCVAGVFSIYVVYGYLTTLPVLFLAWCLHDAMLAATGHTIGCANSCVV